MGVAGLVAGLDGGEHLLGEVLRRVEVAVLEDLTAHRIPKKHDGTQDPEEALDLV